MSMKPDRQWVKNHVQKKIQMYKSSSFWEIEPDKQKHLKTQAIDLLGKSKISASNKIKKFQTPGDHIDHFSTVELEVFKPYNKGFLR